MFEFLLLPLTVVDVLTICPALSAVQFQNFCLFELAELLVNLSLTTVEVPPGVHVPALDS